MTILAPRRHEAREDIAADVLIEEARRRHRRRQLAILGALVVAVAGALGGFALSSSSTPPSAPPLQHVAGASPLTVVDAAAMAGHGNVVFVSLGDLFVLDGATGKVANVTRGNRTAVNPEFSPNGKWLIYETGGIGGASWLARASGFGSRRLGGSASWLANGQLEIAGTQTGSSYTVEADGSLRLVRANFDPAATATTGGARYVFGSNTLQINPPHSSSGVERIETSVSPTGPRTLWYSTRDYFAAAGGKQGTFVGVAGILPNNEVLLLTIDNYCCDYADGVQLYELRSPGGVPRPLGTVLNGSLVPSYGPDGTFAVASGGNRYAWANKSVELCNGTTATCRPLAMPAGVLTVAPAWSPNHQALAFVEAASQSQGMIGQPQVAQWYATHHLYLLTSRSKDPVEVAGSKGAIAPIWSSDSKSLMFVRNDALFLIPKTGATPVEMAGPLFTPSNWSAYYGEINWNSQFAWSAR